MAAYHCGGPGLRRSPFNSSSATPAVAASASAAAAGPTEKAVARPARCAADSERCGECGVGQQDRAHPAYGDLAREGTRRDLRRQGTIPRPPAGVVEHAKASRGDARKAEEPYGWTGAHLSARREAEIDGDHDGHDHHYHEIAHRVVMCGSGYDPGDAEGQKRCEPQNRPPHRLPLPNGQQEPELFEPVADRTEYRFGAVLVGQA